MKYKMKKLRLRDFNTNSEYTLCFSIVILTGCIVLLPIIIIFGILNVFKIIIKIWLEYK